MGLRIQHNLEAFNAHRQLVVNAAAASKSMQRLSSGYRINGASDDAAGLAISEKLRGQIGGLAQAQRNGQDSISLLQTAEGALGEVHSMLGRIRDLKVQINNGTLSSDDQDAIAGEVAQLAGEIKDIVNPSTGTRFNGKALFSASPIVFQVGANDGETITYSPPDLSTAASVSGLQEITDLAGNAAAAKTALTNMTSGTLKDLATLDSAIKNVSGARGTIGALQNRLEYRLNNLATYQENLTSAESRVRDVDMASEMTEFTKRNILQQVGMSMLAQANQATQNVLSLLR